MEFLNVRHALLGPGVLDLSRRSPRAAPCGRPPGTPPGLADVGVRGGVVPPLMLLRSGAGGCGDHERPSLWQPSVPAAPPGLPVSLRSDGGRAPRVCSRVRMPLLEALPGAARRRGGRAHAYAVRWRHHEGGWLPARRAAGRLSPRKLLPWPMPRPKITRRHSNASDGSTTVDPRTMTPRCRIDSCPSPRSDG